MENPTTGSHWHFLSGGGEAAELIRNYDWTATPLGPIETWPISIKTTIGLILRSPVPIVTLWGELGTMIYNDAYSVFAGGRHPALLGSEVRKGWPEVADFNDNVMRVGLAGGTLSYQDQELTLHRSGKPERVFMNLDYSPVLGEEGQPIGVVAIVVETTDRRWLEAQRAGEQDRQRRLFEQAPGFIVIMRGAEHVVEFVNDAHRSMFKSGDWLGRTMREAFPSIAGQGFYEALDDVFRFGQTKQFNATPVEFRTSPNSPAELRFLTFIYAPLYDEDGQITGVFCEGYDATTAHLAQRRSAALAALGDSIRDASNADDLAYSAAEILGRELNVSRAGYGTIDKLEETISIERDWNAPGIMSLAGTLHFRDYGSYIEELKRGETVVITDAFSDPRTADTASNLKVVNAQALVNMPLTERGGVVALLYLNNAEARVWSAEELDFVKEVADRTRTAVERLRAEAEIRLNTERLRFLDALSSETARLVEAEEILTVTTRMLGEFLKVSICAYADMDADEDHFTIRGDWSEPGLPSIRGYYSLADFGQPAVRNLGAGRELVVNDNRVELAPQEAATFQAIGISATICVPLVKDGRLTALMAVHHKERHRWTEREVSMLREVAERSWAHIERTRSDAAARENDAQFRALAQAMPNHVWTAKPDGLLDWFNDQVYAFSGAGVGELDGHHWGKIVHPEDMTSAALAWQAALESGSNYETEFRLRRSDGAWRWHLARATPMRDNSGQITRWVGTNTDVDDQKNSEALLEARLEERTLALAETSERLQQSQKMEAIGNLTGGIAHDFNNLLAAVVGSLELLRKRMPPDPGLQRLVDNAMEGANRGAALTRRMLAFARRQVLRSERIDVRDLVDGMRDLLERSLGPTVRVEIDLPPGLPQVETDPNQLETALLNLAVNARDAMSGEGVITISGNEAALARSEFDLAPGRYLRLTVTDTGEGMDEETLQRAIEPFFTTKGVGKGTGLGLSMVHGLATQSGGTLVLRSSRGEGTSADIWLPAAVAPLAATAAQQVIEQEIVDNAGALRPLRILAVDDDALVLMNTTAMLEDMGHRVIAAYSGREALKRVAEDDSFDLIITDHAMPQMTGAQLAKELRRNLPNLPILLATGYAELPSGEDPGLPRLSKPFGQSDLERAIESTVRRQ